MIPDFSEFSYGYSLIREIEDVAGSVLPGNVGRPVLPTLREEKDLGWDVGYVTCAFALFLQFKRGEYVSRPHPDSPTWGAVGQPHYRFAVDTAGHQFRALRNFSLMTASQPCVVAYAAPRFHKSTSFTRFHLAKEVVANSYGCTPDDVTDDGDMHFRVVDRTGVDHWVCSDPSRVADFFDAERLRGVFEQAERPTLEVALGAADRSFAVEGLIGALRAAWTETGGGAMQTRSPADASPSEQIAFWANLFGIVPLIWLSEGS